MIRYALAATVAAAALAAPAPALATCHFCVGAIDCRPLCQPAYDILDAIDVDLPHDH